MKLVTNAGDLVGTPIGGKVATLLHLGEHFPVPALVGLVQSGLDDEEIPCDLEAFVAEQPTDSLYAIRSSANVEDSDSLSFAGVFETRLGVTVDQIPNAVRAVLASRGSAKVHEYAEEKDVDPKTIRMGVGIQRMIRSDVSGVSFSRSPTSPETNVIVEAIFGLGELLVQGLVTPESWTVPRAGRGAISTVRSHQKEMLIVDLRGGTRAVKLPSTDRRSNKLTSDEARAVATMALAVEAALDVGGADIEWAFEGGHLWLLQARPLTTLGIRNT